MTDQAPLNNTPQANVTSEPAKDPAPAPAKPVEDTAVKPEAVSSAPNESLEKLLAHIESLQQTNTNLEKAIQVVREGNLAKLKENMNTNILPWIDKLDISPEYKESFMQGVEAACSASPNSTVSDFEKNPVYQVVCSAAAAHGTAIKELEETRQALERSKNAVHEKENETANMIRDKTDALLYANKSPRDAGNKRGASEISQDMDSDHSSLWSTMFDTMRSRNY